MAAATNESSHFQGSRRHDVTPLAVTFLLGGKMVGLLVELVQFLIQVGHLFGRLCKVFLAFFHVEDDANLTRWTK